MNKTIIIIYIFLIYIFDSLNINKLCFQRYNNNKNNTKNFAAFLFFDEIELVKFF